MCVIFSNKIYDLILSSTTVINLFQYQYLITSLDRLCDHPLSSHVKDFILKYRKTLVVHTNELIIPPVSISLYI